MSPTSPADRGLFDLILEAVARIPAGRVSTYGAIARSVTGRPSGARTVGWALSGLDGPAGQRVPWWRVIDSRGRISIAGRDGAAAEQRARLAAEGVAFQADGRVDLAVYGFDR